MKTKDLKTADGQTGQENREVIMTKTQRETAERILNALEREDFRVFYEGRFVEYIEDSEAVDREDILEEIASIFRL